ncbi:MAG: Asp-tRNA(Asn)/Glu-tRNA(Gln) amidotransferase GatCAB subunit B, partial [Planctomycetes bacterium]|nr:Asp-tRNA(Asn)/Glu-tRNA(Gln) amidotransferase GatCAB subunit B [Planctomycetota bacterium]
TGTPLLEIVSEPDLRSPAEAKEYLSEMKLLLTYLGVSDCNMQEGSLRVDANINLHVETPEGKIATPIVEVKNMNSFRAVERALVYEVSRQWKLWQQTGQKLGEVPKQTRGWDDAAQITRGQRSKEESSDYRYLPDPDLVPVRVSREEIDAVRSSLGELPAALRSRLQESYDITPDDADVLVNQGRPLVDYYVRLAELAGDGKLAANWIRQDVLRTLKESGGPIGEFPLSADLLAELLLKVKAGELDTSRGRQVLAAMVTGNQSAEAAMQQLGIAAVDSGDLESLCRELLAANPKIVADVQAGKQQAVGALIGQAKQKNPNVNPAQVRQLCLDLIAKM